MGDKGANGANESRVAVVIKIPPSSHADDESFSATVASIVNTAYTEAEQDIFLPNYQRTSPTEIAQFVRNGQLAVAYLEDCGHPIGCVCIKLLGPGRGEFGMLALDAKHQGAGNGCTIMQLEVLVPTTFHHAGKERMQAWYQRLGYQVIKLGRFDEDYPELAKILSGPTDYKIFEKKLVKAVA
ncbi:hypothetical protein N0V84_012324 [Fusarium piperis]|uniref:N-acetyltransferase domain-containing protein n=1 Tax=Fusarium piperis TaxID=1435070 RepID=A0A9W8VZX0_9HYPO|nr:hypothetical protein N0V84_012324 [Fusarium piperis]